MEPESYSEMLNAWIGFADEVSGLMLLDSCNIKMEVNGMPIIFQPRIVGNGPYKHANWIERRIKKMCAEIVKAKMVEETGETEEGLFCRLERKYGSKRFSDLRIHIDRGSVKYDAQNMTWHGVFRVLSRENHGV